MWELKSHEYIENHFIMDRLKARLQKNRVRELPEHFTIEMKNLVLDSSLL